MRHECVELMVLMIEAPTVALCRRPHGIWVMLSRRARKQGEWFRTGDLAVQHPEGRVELKDRAKDIIIRCGSLHGLCTDFI